VKIFKNQAGFEMYGILK